MSSAVAGFPFPGSYPAAERAESGSAWLVRLGTGLGGWIAPLLVLYVMIGRPLLFGAPLPSLSEDVLGWTVVNDPYPANPMKQVPYPVLFALAAFAMICSGAYRRLPLLNPTLLVLGCFMGYALASIAWSLMPGISALRATLLVATTLSLVLSIYASRNYSVIMRRLFWIMFLTTVLNIAALAIRPSTDIGHSGIYDHKNVLGWVAAFILYFGCYRLIIGTALEKSAAVIMILSAPAFLVLSESKTSIGLAGLAPIIATGLWVAARYFRLSATLLLMSLIGVAVLIFFIGQEVGKWDLFIVNDAIFGNPTLTGRTEIWRFVVGLISERPIFGYGYEAVFSTGPDGIVARQGVGFVRVMPTSHNGYLDITVQLGLVGLVLDALYIFLAFHTVSRLIDINPALCWLGLTLFVFVMLHNCLESDVLLSSNPLSIMLMILFLLATRMVSEQVRPPPPQLTKDHSAP